MIQIRSPQTPADFKDYYRLRYQVLRAPFGQHKGTEKDDYEPLSQHFMAVDDAAPDPNGSTPGVVVGCVKFYEKEPGLGVLSHLAVDRAYQGQGIGRRLIQAAELAALQRGCTTLGIFTRLTASAFFEKYGYTIAGLPSVHFGTTPMVWMEKNLLETPPAA